MSKVGPGPPSAPPRDPMTPQRPPRTSPEHPLGAQRAKNDAKSWPRGAPREPRGSKMEPKSHPKSTKNVTKHPNQNQQPKSSKKTPQKWPKGPKFDDFFDPKTALNQISADKRKTAFGPGKTEVCVPKSMQKTSSEVLVSACWKNIRKTHPKAPKWYP